MQINNKCIMMNWKTVYLKKLIYYLCDAKLMKYQMKVEDFKKEFGGIEMVKYDMKMRKAIDVLKENN